MEIKVNDYIRTDKGTIDKITDKNIMIYEVALMGFGEKPIKTSPNIIDLIEVGDYVNGMRVSELLKRGKKETKYIRFMADSDYEFSTELKEEEIETILTKEQFEQMEYKIN